MPRYFTAFVSSNLISLFLFFHVISFAKETKTFNVTKLKKEVGRDTATAEGNYSGPG